MKLLLLKYFNSSLVHYVNLLLLLILFVIETSCKNEPELTKKSGPQPNTPTPSPPVIKPLESCSSHILYGYCDKISYESDEKIITYIQSKDSIKPCRLEIYDLNQKYVFSSIPNALFEQKISNNEPAENGFGFIANDTIEIPKSIKSGVYLIDGKIPFIVKEKNPVDLLIIYPSNTANAYCESGGKSLYSYERPMQVSFERPISLQRESLQCMKFFSEFSYSVGYAADIDLNDYANISKAKILVIVGHNEYWTWRARKNFDKFVHNGGHALVLSGNTMWWQVRYSENKKKLICYKSKSDPIAEPELKTVGWYDPALNYPIISSIGCDSDHGGYGIRYPDAGWDGYKITLPESPLLKGLNFVKGDILSLPTGEYDGAPIKEFVDGFPVLDKTEIGAHRVELIGFDYGMRGGKTTVGTFIVMQPKKDSGVIVNVGSIDWCSENGIGGPERTRIQQITVNAIIGMMNNQSLFVQ